MRIKSFILTIFSSLILVSSAFAGSVDRGQFTTDVVDREPVDRVEVLESGAAQIKYFTELADLQGQTITHQWVYDDQVMFEKSFDVGGPRWRVWTSKTLQPGWTGIWYVHTVDGAGEKLMTQSFEYR
jgi:hypothetical protein